MSTISFVILGQPYSKANSRRLVRFGNRPAFIKSKEAVQYQKDFQTQCRKLSDLMTGDVAVSIKIYYGSRRPDLDESVILDCMQGLIYVNDRQVKEKHIYWGLDKDNPRSEITVTEL